MQDHTPLDSYLSTLRMLRFHWLGSFVKYVMIAFVLFALPIGMSMLIGFLIGAGIGF